MFVKLFKTFKKTIKIMINNGGCSISFKIAYATNLVLKYLTPLRMIQIFCGITYTGAFMDATHRSV